MKVILWYALLWLLVGVSFSSVVAKGVEAVPSEGGTGCVLSAVPEPAPKGDELAPPKVLFVPCPDEKRPPPVVPEPNGAGFDWPKLKPGVVLLAFPKLPELPKAFPVWGAAPNRPPPPPVFVAVVELAKGLGFAPKREFELAVLLPKPGEKGVSWGWSSGTEDNAGKDAELVRALASGVRFLAGASVRPLPANLEASSPLRRYIANARRSGDVEEWRIANVLE